MAPQQVLREREAAFKWLQSPEVYAMKYILAILNVIGSQDTLLYSPKGY